MTIVPAKLKVSHPNPKLASQKAVGRALGKVLADAASHGWSMVKLNNEMEKVLRNLKITYRDSAPAATKIEAPKTSNREPATDRAKAYAGDLEPSNDWPAANP